MRRLSAEPGFVRGALCAGAAQIVLSALGAGIVAALVSGSSVGAGDADGVAIALGALSMFVTAALSGAFGVSQAATLGAPTRRVARLAGTTGAAAVAALLALASLSALPAPGMALVDMAFGVAGAALGSALLARRLHEVA
ncbi:MAG TPA: hypothetical protein VGI54_11870 [Solirubrobacteraceae bacterium]